MRKFSKSSDHFYSDANGVYDISFFSSSVGHSIDNSKKVFSVLTGSSLANFSRQWHRLSKADKQVFLVEHHESAHHSLLFSTPAGTLLWRLNQILSRDINYISRKLSENNLKISKKITPQCWLNGEKFSSELDRVQNLTLIEKSYFRHVVSAIEKCLYFRKIFFESDAPKDYANLTIGELLDLTNFVYPYIQERCDTSHLIKWTTSLALDSKVFPNGRAFNVLDIAECHAIAKEVFILRALGDLQGAQDRIESSYNGPFAACMQKAVDIANYNNPIGFSPHGVQIAALLACSSSLDLTISESRESRIEEELPWWRISDRSIFEGQSYESLMSLAGEPIIGPGSNWILFSDFESNSNDNSFENLITTLSSFGLDQQIYNIHRGAECNAKFLVESLQISQTGLNQDAYDEWDNFLFLNKAMVEFTDAILFRGTDVSVIYPEEHPIWELSGMEQLRLPHYQILSHIINGAIVRQSLALYIRVSIPTIDIIINKIKKYIANEYEGITSKTRIQEIQHIAQVVLDVLFKKHAGLPFESKHVRSIRTDRFI